MDIFWKFVFCLVLIVFVIMSMTFIISYFYYLNDKRRKDEKCKEQIVSNISHRYVISDDDDLLIMTIGISLIAFAAGLCFGSKPKRKVKKKT